MHLVVFEDAHWPLLAPLSISRPAYDLLCGARTLLQRMIRHLQPTRLSIWVRPELAEICTRRLAERGIVAAINQPLDDHPAMLMNARMLLLPPFDPSIPGLKVDDGSLAWLKTTSPGLKPADALSSSPRFLQLAERLPVATKSPLIKYAWDLLFPTEAAIADDSTDPPFAAAPVQAGPWHLVQPYAIHLGERVLIEPGVVLDASRGPILLDRDVLVGANAVIRGPVYIGPSTQIAPLTYLRPGVCVGENCRLGGELSACIIHSYSNKGHYGFVGDSVIGQWVNLGAGTTTSNLKNTYDNVSVPIAGKSTPTGRLLAGAMIGDHTKTGINCRLTTGSYIGYCCSLAGSAIAPAYIPSFSWISDRGTDAYRKDKALGVMRAVYSRRGILFTEAQARDVEQFARFAADAEKLRA